MSVTKRLGLSVGMALSAGLLASAVGVLAAMMMIVGSALIVALLAHLFPGYAQSVTDRLLAFLSE